MKKRLLFLVVAGFFVLDWVITKVNFNYNDFKFVAYGTKSKGK